MDKTTLAEEMLAIHSRVCGVLSNYEGDVELEMDKQAMVDSIQGCFFDGKASKVYLVNKQGDMVLYPLGSAWRFIEKTFGPIYDSNEIWRLAEEAGGTNDEILKRGGRAFKTVEDGVLSVIRYYHQRSVIEMRVDMFTDRPRVELLDEKARVVFPHRPFVPRLQEYDQAVVDDFIEHFPIFRQFLDWLVCARFARDRKSAYIWLHCESDWGKGFLLALLSSLGGLVEMSVKEIEALFEGKPAGRQMQDFKRAFALAVDEFKSARSELKQLQNEISLAPKNQLTQYVEVFVKLFLSAEDVPSFASDEGIEDQFANRFNYYRGYGRLNDRDLFIEMGAARYFDHLQSFVAGHLNERVEAMRAEGRARAECFAEDGLDAFREEHRVTKAFEAFSDTIEDKAEQFLDWLVERYLEAKDRYPLGRTLTAEQKAALRNVREKDGVWYLQRAGSVVGHWIKEEIDRSSAASVSFKRGEIAKQCSVGKAAAVNIKFGGEQAKVIELALNVRQKERINGESKEDAAAAAAAAAEAVQRAAADFSQLSR